MDLILVAASGLARELLDSVAAAGQHRVVGFVDDAPSLAGTVIHDLPVLGPLAELAHHPEPLLTVCAGRGQAREVIVHRLADLGVAEDRYATLVDPTVRVPPSCRVGPGSILLANTVLTADIEIGRHVVVMPNVTVTHDDRVEDFATLCAGVSLGGSVRIGRAAYLGMNACVREYRSVGAEATLGMGAALVQDLPAQQTWAGVPARPVGATALAHSSPLTREELSA